MADQVAGHRLGNINGALYCLHYGNGGLVDVLTEVGATLREFRAGGRAVLDGFAEHDVCPGGRGHQLMPWPNRVGDGRYAFQGRDYQLSRS